MNVVSRRLRGVLRRTRGLLPYYRRLQCPVCLGWDRHFRTFGRVPRQDARCPHCGALERHRLVWLFLQRRTDLFGGSSKRVLHFAPERALQTPLGRVASLDYVTADLRPGMAMVVADITSLQFADESFDVVYCSHVLEHVPDDRAAIGECYRVLKRGGWAVFMVPIHSGTTVEDPSITDPAERERRFGQRDHVRVYGSDFSDRLRHAGFEVQSFAPGQILAASETRFAIPGDEGPIFFCSRH